MLIKETLIFRKISKTSHQATSHRHQGWTSTVLEPSQELLNKMEMTMKNYYLLILLIGFAKARVWHMPVKTKDLNEVSDSILIIMYFLSITSSRIQSLLGASIYLFLNMGQSHFIIYSIDIGDILRKYMI